MKATSVPCLLLSLVLGGGPTPSSVVALDNGVGRTPPLGWSRWARTLPCQRLCRDPSTLLAALDVMPAG